MKKASKEPRMDIDAGNMDATKVQGNALKGVFIPKDHYIRKKDTLASFYAAKKVIIIVELQEKYDG